MSESKLIEAGLIEMGDTSDPEETFRRLMEMWPKKPLKRRPPSFSDLPPADQKYLAEQYDKISGKIFGKRTDKK